MNATRLARTVALVAIALTVAACSIWPGSRRASRVPDLAPLTSQVAARQAWNVSLPGGAGLGFQPVIVADTVYAADRRGHVVAIDAASGSARWRADLDQALIAGVGSDGRTTVVGARDGTLVALDESGHRKWTARLSAEAVSVPTVGMGLVLVRSSDNRIVALDVDSGEQRWMFERQAPALVLRQTAAMAMDPATAYVGLPGGRLVALALSNGALRWEAAIGIPRGSNEIERIADVVGSPLVSGSEVCAAAWQTRIVCFDTATGRPLWATEVMAGGGIDLGSGMLVVPETNGVLQAFSLGGAVLWRQDLLMRRAPSTPLLTGRNVVVGDVQGFIHRFDRDDGTPRSRLATDGTAITAAPVYAAGRAIVQTAGGSLYALALD